MKTLNRILQILALCGALASAAFYFVAKREIAPAPQVEASSLPQQLAAEKARAAGLADNLADKQRVNDELVRSLQSAKSEALALAAQLTQLQRENQRFAEERSTRQAIEARLQDENARLARELAQTQADTIPRDQLATKEQTIENLERQVLALQQTSLALASPRDLAGLQLPAKPSLRGNVLTVGKGASFVVLDIGYTDGVRLLHELFVQHADTPIAKIQVTEVKENLSIARVLPDSLLKAPQSGDAVSSFN